MLKTLKIIKKTISIIITILFIAFFVAAAFSTFNAMKTGEPATVLGYRPVFILSGSMEPEIETNGVVVTHEVNSIEDIAVGDVITFKVPEENNLTVTHRIISIEDGIIKTKGDNNRVADLYDTTIDEVDSKVVLIINQTAWFINQWNKSLAGKIVVITIPLSAICFIYFLWSFVKEFAEKIDDKIKQKKNPQMEASAEKEN